MATFGSTRTLQTSFASGELAPALHARIDINRYVSGLKTCLNFIVRAHGGAANRPGTTNVGGVKSFLPARLIPFAFSTDQTYVLEWVANAMRWYTGGKRLVVTKTDAAVTNGTFDFDINGWTDLSTGDAEIAASGIPKLITGGTALGTMTDGAGLSQAFNGDETQSYSEAVRMTDSEDAWIGKDWGSGQTRTVTRIRIVATSDSGFKTGGDPSSLLFRVEGSNDGFLSYKTIWDRVTSDAPGKIIDDNDGINTTTAYRYHRLRIQGGDDAKDITLAQVSFFQTLDAGKMLLTGAIGETARASQSIALGAAYRGKRHALLVRVAGEPTLRAFLRVGKTVGGDDILDDRELRPGWHVLAFWPAGSSFHIEFREVDGNELGIDYVAFLGSNIATDSTPLELPHQYQESQLRSIKFVQSADVMTLVHPSHVVRELRRYGPYDWSLLEPAFAPAPPQPLEAAWEVEGDGGGTDKTFRYKVTYEYAGGEEGLASEEKSIILDPIDETHSVSLTIDYPYPNGVVRANVYKYKAGTFGFIGSTEDGTFLEDVSLNPELDDTPTSARNPFDAVGKFPAAVGFFEQRRAFGGSDLAPDTVELSQTGAYSNFSKSEPTKDSDAITATLSSTQVNRIRHLIGMQALLIGTSGGWWKLARGDQGLTPALEGGVSKQGSIGVSEIAPIEVGSGAILWVARGDRAVRDLGYDFGSDAYGGSELSLLSSHLLEGHRIVEWAFQQDPLSAMWAVRDDGVLLCMTYNKEQEVIGWSRHETDGHFESICCVSEPEGDAVYVVVRRRVNGAWRRQVERFASRIIRDLRDSHFVDGGVVVDLPRDVIGVNVGGVLVVRVPGHGCVAGDRVEVADATGTAEINDATGPPEINDKQYVVLSAAGSFLNLGDLETGLPVDASTWSEWTGGGYVRKAVSSVTGLSHLEGKTVSILADGNVHPQRVVTGGVVTLDAPACRVHVGLPYVCELETLALPMAPEQFGRRKRLTAMQLHIAQSRSVRVAASPEQGMEPDWEELAQRTDEAWDLPTRLATGKVELTLPQKWQETGQGLVQQIEPLPLEVLAVEAMVDVGG